MSPTPKPDQRHSDASQPAPTPQTSADPVEPALTVGRTQPSDPPNRDPVNLTGPLSVAGRTLLPNRSGYSRGFREDLLSLVELVEAGALTTVIDRTYGLHQTPEAMTYLSTDEGTGSEPLVLTVCPGSGLATASISRYEVGPFATDVKGGLEPPCCCQTDAGRRRSGRQDSNLRPRWREVSTCRRERWRPGEGFSLRLADASRLARCHRPGCACPVGRWVPNSADSQADTDPKWPVFALVRAMLGTSRPISRIVRCAL